MQGTISEAVVTGLCLENAGDLAITVSPRNAERAAALAAKFPKQVRIGKDNQDVVDSSDIVCIGVVPKLAEEVLAALSFRADQTVVGFMSTTKLDVIKKHAAPATKVLETHHPIHHLFTHLLCLFADECVMLCSFTRV